MGNICLHDDSKEIPIKKHCYKCATVLKSIAVDILREDNVDFIILKMVCVLIVEAI